MGLAMSPFTSAETHGIALRPVNRLLATSDALGWRELHADVYRDSPNTSRYPGIAAELLIFHLRQPARVSRSLGFGVETVHCSPREFTILPSDAESEWRVEGAPEVLHISLRRSLIDRCIDELHGADATGVTLLPRFATVDPLLEQLALGVLQTMQDRPFGHELYIDCLGQMMVAHLVHHHSSLSRPPRTPKPDGLTDYRLRRIADYVDSHLGEDLSLETLAEQAGLSPLYLARSFKRAFGEPPHRYVVSRRVERAKDLIRSTCLPLAEVALACGFSDQSHLSQVFKRLVGVTPGAYRNQRLI